MVEAAGPSARLLRLRGVGGSRPRAGFMAQRRRVCGGGGGGGGRERGGGGKTGGAVTETQAAGDPAAARPLGSPVSGRERADRGSRASRRAKEGAWLPFSIFLGLSPRRRHDVLQKGSSLHGEYAYFPSRQRE
nr:U1 small nuclear ribonucleoprotein 70 kDa-like [Camelus dromedarius]